MKDALNGLMASKKALVMFAATIAIVTLIALGKVDETKGMIFLTVTLPMYLAATAYQDSKTKSATIYMAGKTATPPDPEA